MSDWKVPLADVVVPEGDIDAVVGAYRSGWLSMGPRTESLEEAFSRYTGAEHSIAVANGTAGLHLVCMAAALAPGDEVVVPSLTFVATVNAIAYTGARPVFADVVSVTEPWLSAAAVGAAITPRTKAVMSMAYGGHPGQLEELRTLADRHGIALLEDAAHAAGSRLDGRHVGRFRAPAGFSFFSHQNPRLRGGCCPGAPRVRRRARPGRRSRGAARATGRAPRAAQRPLPAGPQLLDLLRGEPGAPRDRRLQRADRHAAAVRPHVGGPAGPRGRVPGGGARPAPAQPERSFELSPERTVWTAS